MAVRLDEQAFCQAAEDMEDLLDRTRKLKTKLEEMYHSLTHALDTPAGHQLEFVSKKKLITPVEDMILVIQHTSQTVNMLIGKSGTTGVYYDKIFSEYKELERILVNKSKG